MTRGSPPKEKPPTAGEHREGQHGRPQDITRSPGIPGNRSKKRRAAPNVVSLAEHDFRWTSGLTLGPRGIRGTHGTVLTVLRHHPAIARRLAFNVRSGVATWTDAPPWHREGLEYPRAVVDVDATRAAQWGESLRLPVFLDDAERFCPVVATPDVWMTAILAEAAEHPYDPVRIYLESLRGEWDGIPRASRLAPFFLGAGETFYERQALQNLVVAAVARALHPGCKVDSLPVLEGPQGIGKSTAIKVLAGGDGFFTDEVPDLGSKDAAIQLQGPWFIELGELASLRRNEIETVKRFISATSDRYRAPYGRIAEDHPRRIVFVGTTNESEYLRDTTGNRRFWPVRVGVDGPIRVHELGEQRDQIWAEALVLFERGAPWWEIDQRAHALETEARMVTDPWDDAIHDYVARRERVTIPEILEEALDVPAARQTQAESNRVARTLRRLGWERRQVRVIDDRTGEGVRRWVYEPPREEAAE